MAISAKAVAGGSILLGASGVVSFGIHKTSKEQYTTIWGQLITSKFNVLDINDKTNKGSNSWKATFLKATGKTFATDEEIQEHKNTCKELLNRPFAKSSENYKDAAKNCVEIINLKTKAKNIGLKPLQTPTPSNGKNENQDTWEKKFKAYKTDMGTTISNVEALIQHCHTLGEKTHWDRDFSQDLWNKYIRGCVKSGIKINESKTEEILGRDYWSNEPLSVKEKLELSRFDLLWMDISKEEKEECKQLLSETFTEENESYKNALKKCTAKEGAKERAKRLGLTALEKTNNTEQLKTKWNNASLSEDMKNIGFTKGTDVNTDSTKIADACDKFSRDFNSLPNNEIDSKWYSYIKLCIDESSTSDKWNSILSRSYWTNELRG